MGRKHLSILEKLQIPPSALCNTATCPWTGETGYTWFLVPPTAGIHHHRDWHRKGEGPLGRALPSEPLSRFRSLQHVDTLRFTPDALKARNTIFKFFFFFSYEPKHCSEKYFKRYYRCCQQQVKIMRKYSRKKSISSFLDTIIKNIAHMWQQASDFYSIKWYSSGRGSGFRQSSAGFYRG